LWQRKKYNKRHGQRGLTHDRKTSGKSSGSAEKTISKAAADEKRICHSGGRIFGRSKNNGEKGGGQWQKKETPIRRVIEGTEGSLKKRTRRKKRNGEHLCKNKESLKGGNREAG